MLKSDQEVVVDQRVHEARKLGTENQKEETEIGKGTVAAKENVTASMTLFVFIRLLLFPFQSLCF